MENLIYLKLILLFLLLRTLRGQNLSPCVFDGTKDLGEEARALGPVLLLLCIGGSLSLQEP